MKLTRTTLIIPLVIGFGLALPWLDPEAPKRDVSLAKRVYDSFPVFILLFLAASLIRTVGLTGGHAAEIHSNRLSSTSSARASPANLRSCACVRRSGRKATAVRRRDLVRGGGGESDHAGCHAAIVK